MATPLDLELKKAFGELQVKMVETSKKIQVIDSQIDVLKQVLRHLDITHNEVKLLPPGTKTYECIGRMFLHADLEEIKENFLNKVNHVHTRITECQENKQYLEQNLKESEDNIREMVQQRKNKGEKL